MNLENCLQEIVLQIYQLSMANLSLYAVYAALIFCVLYRKFDGKRWMRFGLWLALGAWFAAVLWITIFSRDREGYIFRWVPLQTYWRVIRGENRELLRSAFMNAVLFFPAGLLWAGLLPRNGSYRSRMLCTVLCFGLFSLAIELSQYFLQLGNAEIDDVLHNTLGAVAGFAAFHLEPVDPPPDHGQ